MDAPGDAVAVVAAIDKERLSAVLSAIHRSGFGHVTRVFDPARADPIIQLHRAGVTPPREFALDRASQVALLVSAPGRTERAAALLRLHGAEAVTAIGRAPAPALAASAAALPAPAPRETAD